MNAFSRLSSRSIKPLALACAVLLPASISLADTIYTAAPKGGTPFGRKGVTITKIEKTDDGEMLRYTTPGGDTASKKLDDIVQIEAEGEAIFNQAEAEFMKPDLQAAGDDYGKAISSTQKDWVKHRSEIRLLFISSKTGDFVAAVRGWVELAKKDPESAASRKPPIPAKSPQLTNGITAVTTSMGGATAETKKVVYPYLVEMYNKNGDTDHASKILDEVKKLTGGQASHPAAAPGVVDNTPPSVEIMAQKQAEADIAITKATSMMASRDYNGVIATINGASKAFVAPDQQAKALYMVAEAKGATAATPEALEDAAMAYMRVVAHFKSQPDPAADALYKTGVIEEKLKKTTEAKLIYGQVITEYHDTNAAKEAQAALAKLN